MDLFKTGELVTCVGARDIDNLVRGKSYRVLEDEEEGFFPGKDNNFVTVQSEKGPLYCRAYRFKR